MGGRVGLIPWMMFLVTACLTAIGAVVPASVAIIAPIGMGFAVRYRINPLLMGLLIINGASAGGFSPISIFGGITNGVVEKANLPGNPTLLFLASFFFNLVLSLIVFFVWGGRELLNRRAELPDAAPDAAPDATPDGGTATPGATTPGTTTSMAASGPGTAPAGGSTSTATLAPSGPAGASGTDGTDGTTQVTSLDRDRTLTLVGLACLAIGALFFDLDVGMLAHHGGRHPHPRSHRTRRRTPSARSRGRRCCSCAASSCTSG